MILLAGRTCWTGRLQWKPQSIGGSRGLRLPETYAVGSESPPWFYSLDEAEGALLAF